MYSIVFVVVTFVVLAGVASIVRSIVKVLHNSLGKRVKK